MDRHEFLAGMAVLAKGTPEERLKLTFHQYVAFHEKNPRMTKGDMYAALKGAYSRAIGTTLRQSTVKGRRKGRQRGREVKVREVEMCDVQHSLTTSVQDIVEAGGECDPEVIANERKTTAKHVCSCVKLGMHCVFLV